MLTLKDLTLTHKKDIKIIIQNLSLIINVGDKLAIIGEEGTGKSTLVHYIYNKNEIDDYIESSGQLTNSFTHMAYISQNCPNDLQNTPLNEFIYANIDYDRFDFNKFYQLAGTLHFNLDLLDKKEMLFSELSGGEKLKIRLIKELASYPDLLILDEPNSDLDIYSIDWLETFIKESDLTIIYISHDQLLLKETATAILHLELIKKRQVPKATYFKGSFTDYLSHKEQAYEKQLKLALKDEATFKAKEERLKRVQNSVNHQLSHTKDSTAGRLLAKKMKTLKSQEKRLDKSETQLTQKPDNMDTIDVFFSDILPLPKSKLLINWEKHPIISGQEVTLQFSGQDTLTIVGKNGVGKSTLLKAIFEELNAKAQISMGYMPQDYDLAFKANQTPITFMTDSEFEKAQTLLSRLDFTRQEMTHLITELSGGQKAKCFIAKMILEGNQVSF